MLKITQKDKMAKCIPSPNGTVTVNEFSTWCSTAGYAVS